MSKAIAVAARNSARRAQEASHQITHVRIIGGFLDGVELDLSAGMNCIIGARGTGKTTVLELVRFALDALPEDGEDARRHVDSVVRSNLGDGRVELMIETAEGVRYTISRAAGEEPLVMTADGSPTEITLRHKSFFRAHIYSQNQIERIADQAMSQLSILDTFEAQRIGEISARIRGVESKLAANASAILPLLEQTAQLTEAVSGLPGVEEKLKTTPPVKGENAVAIERAQHARSLRQRESQAMEGLWQYLKDYDGQLEAVQGQLASRTKPLMAKELSDGPNGGILGALRTAMQEKCAAIEEHLSTARRHVEGLQAVVSETGTTLTEGHARQEMAFRELIEKDQATRSQATERAALERSRNDLVARKRQRELLESRFGELCKQRAALLDKLSELRDQRYHVRDQVARKVNAALHPTLRVRVEQFGHLEAYRTFLDEALRGTARGARARPGSVAQKLIEKLLPHELARLIRERDVTTLKRRAGTTDEQAGKVLEALADEQTLFALEVVEMADRPVIELKDGEEYKPSVALSTGQKCTAILPILLLDSNHPLLIDQPEDNLDNRFVCESVVESILHIKERRQLVFVTHNPNIPVLGEADRVFVLESDGNHARLVAQGDVDECKGPIVNLLEGGEQAFRQRQERYAYS